MVIFGKYAVYICIYIHNFICKLHLYSLANFRKYFSQTNKIYLAKGILPDPMNIYGSFSPSCLCLFSVLSMLICPPHPLLTSTSLDQGWLPRVLSLWLFFFFLGSLTFTSTHFVVEHLFNNGWMGGCLCLFHFSE